MKISELKIRKSPGTDQNPAELIQAGGICFVDRYMSYVIQF
jgi:hypothetical protein